MANSTIQASITLQILDNLGVTTNPLMSRIVPPIQYPALSANYAGYFNLQPGSSFNALAAVGAVALTFAFVRNATPTNAANSVIQITLLTEGATNSTLVELTPGGCFLIGMPTTVTNALISELNISTLNNLGAVVEFLLGTGTA